MKKLGTLILALALVLSLGIGAFAEAEPMPEAGILSSSETSIVIPKEIKAYNPTGSTVNAPSITYSYTIEPGSAGKNIKDANGISVDTVAGPEGATITESITWDAAADQMTTASGGADNVKNITVDFSAVNFEAAGVYRYKITESATYTNTGVVDGGDHTRYLDVYVKNSATEGQYEIYGYVLFTNDNDIDGTDSAEEGKTVADAAKTQGFIGENADKYYTYNLIIGKTLTGDDGMKNHQFPFGVSFEGSEVGVLPIITGTSGTTVPSWTTKGAMSSFNTTVETATLKIASGKTVTITGIPVGTSAVINEKNDVVGTTYQAASTGADENAASKYVATGDTSNDATVNAQTAGSAADKTVTFENTLKLISPTGIAFRVAPYALMLVGGIVLLLIGRRRKANAEE